ncbi:DNA double-strand break repair protein Mre11 [Halobacterium jilantaiense]|uniref:DNA double-strand break repair protein Mre11 n=1 Tax=Halobacterium jilantaiense TaxID=355548 RepID=A0A1I0NN91_9EURY|nr:DNA double-strand break repair protein Mre11 [Halobacterium jilantaiense]SEW02948.1 DNA repair exonuclease SbcCD nuclease subunit [Halobacterium jilantaiense]
MARVIHTGDTHLGYRQYHAPERRQDFLDAFRAVVEDAVAEDVDAVVHAGDLYHDRQPGLRDILDTISVLRPLRDADIPFLAVVGNHEGTRDAQWLDLFETLGLAERLGDSPRRVGDTAFYGLDYVPESKRDDLDYEFDAHDADRAALVSHGLFTPFPHADWDLDAVLRESTVDFDAVLLGDNHAADTAQVDDTWVTYCGSTERASASERDPRGYNVVEFDEDVAISRKGIDTRDFVFVDVDLGSEDGTAFVQERLREHDLTDAVVVVTVEGDGENVTPAEIERFGDDHGALLTRVNDRREVDSESDVEVSFADPDDAVRERVREMGLSEPALDVDQTVRDATIAGGNVRERVKQRAEAVLDGDDGGLDAGSDEDGNEDEASATDSGTEAGADAGDDDSQTATMEDFL